MTADEKFMKAAITQARKAYAIDEVPIGCVIVQNDKIIARGYNRRNIDKNTLAHAELSAIRKASKKNRRLAAGRLYDVCHLRTVSDVCRCNRTIPYETRRDWFNECQSRLRGFHFEPSANATI